MADLPPFTDAEIQALPMRIYTSEVCRLARYGLTTLWRKRQRGEMPEPIDHGKQDVFDRDAVFKALGMFQDAASPAADTDVDLWSVNPDAIRRAQLGQVRDAAPAQGRHVSGVLPGSRKAAAPRLVVSNPAAGRG